MSLFKARDWWQTQCGHGEEFDMGCLLVANVDNDPSGQAKIVTGSFSGFLRVYLPRERGYRPEDLLLEAELEGGPCLQLAAGRFTGSGSLQLAVLHPRKLTVYSLAAQGGGSYLQLTRLYEHWLEHTAANMTYGPFGGVQGCDYIAVQSYDGQLYFFEAEALAFTRYLPHFLVPGPLAYVDVADTFVTCTAALELEAYRYRVITAASGDKAAAGHNGLSSPNGASAPAAATAAKKMQADWRVVLGEAAIDIRVGRYSQGLSSHSADIVVLGEHNLFVLSSAGQITFQKRLEYHPACCVTYPVPGAKAPGGAENLLVATHTRALLVYRSSTLCWAARAELQPVALAVAELPGLRGGLVALEDTGRLAVCYLGTDPLTNPVGFTEGKDLDYEAMAREHRALAQLIREHGGGPGGGRLVEPPDRLIMRAQIPHRLDPPTRGSLAGEDSLGEVHGSGGGGGAPGGRRLTIKLYLALQGAMGVDSVTLTVSAPEPLVPVTPEVLVPDVSTSPQDPTVVLITLATGCGVPSHATATVVATYTTLGGEPRSQLLELQLPLCAFCSVVPPVKSAEFKVTLTTNRPPPPLGSIFEDALAAAPPGVAQALAGPTPPGAGGGAGGSSSSVLSFLFHGGLGSVTVLVSKAGGRYRVQGDVLEGMWLIVQELASRLARYYGEAEAGLAVPAEGPFAVSFEDALPLDDFFEVAEQHFTARLRVQELTAQLEDRAVQFRNVEKRLLMRFKDKNPAPLNQLDTLMDETFSGLMAGGGAMEEAQAAVAAAARRLAGCVQLLLLLIRWRFGLTDAEFAVLRGCLSPEIHDGSEGVGWEEATEAACTHLLRSCLAKNAKEQAVQVPPLAPAKDTTRLRKHVSLVLERLARGMRLVAPGEAGGVLAAAAGAAGARLYTQQESMGVQQQQQQYDGYEGANGADGVGARVMVVEGEEDGGQQGGYDGGYGGGYGGGYEEGM